MRKRWAGAKVPKLEMDTVVLLREDNIPPLRWRLGRVTKIDTGGDGEVRVAEVRTSTGHVTRAVRQLCPLPFEGNNVD